MKQSKKSKKQKKRKIKLREKERIYGQSQLFYLSSERKRCRNNEKSFDSFGSITIKSESMCLALKVFEGKGYRDIEMNDKRIYCSDQKN